MPGHNDNHLVRNLDFRVAMDKAGISDMSRLPEVATLVLDTREYIVVLKALGDLRGADADMAKWLFVNITGQLREAMQ